jgi:purine-nucleoside phosphorylase
MKEEKTLIFFVDDKAKITNAGKDMSFAGLKKGMRVSVKCRNYGDKMIAVRIRVLTKSAKEV